ncbi:uncharacterized protein BJ171DRAFT_121123 [Polychytrium aggregatum]|uniref:uncharacterized protein n=1 Tax=Polychytrium aggregatum TaxID=110093 RepID=UPI0022FEFFF0|nr:uncharacterized protein BJ171DRAFT_121123 [Polychytrium aggregatum]KAI9204216.1 hypothetical protein BJ171DRAFT_121123 [Polychytrium aggregatum]
MPFVHDAIELIGSAATHPVMSPLFWLAAVWLLAPFATALLAVVGCCFGLLYSGLGLWRRLHQGAPINWNEEIVLIVGGNSGIGRSLLQSLKTLSPRSIVVIDIDLSTILPEHQGLRCSIGYRCAPSLWVHFSRC